MKRKRGKKKTTNKTVTLKKRVVTKTVPKANASRSGSPEKLIDARIKELGDWRGEMLSRLRTLIHEADSGVIEEWKWSVPAWSRDGLICTGETYKTVVKLTFPKGASLPDPAHLFNSSLEGNVRRAIDFREGEGIREEEFKALVRAAIGLNVRVTMKK